MREFPAIVSFVLLCLDVFAVASACLVAYYVRHGRWTLPPEYQVALVLGILLVLLLSPSIKPLRSWQAGELMRELRSLTLAWAVTTSALIVIGFLMKTSALYSRTWMAMWVALAWGLMVACHVAFFSTWRWIRRRGWNVKRIAIIGAGTLGREVVRRINQTPWTGLEVAAFYDDNPTLHHEVVEGVEIRGSPAKLLELLDNQKIDEVWLALSRRAEQRISEILFDLRHRPVVVRLVSEIFGFRLKNYSIIEEAGIPLLDLTVSPMVGMNRLVKALEDRILASLILVVASPLMLLIALGVKLTSSGPVFFRQRRHGWDGQPIMIYKFRSMVVHEESDRRLTQASKSDSRVTPFGAFLRRTSLDELPQFINVLQGRMSIVGPRPHAVEHNEQYKVLIDTYMQRHKVKPGITGWAQINGWRGETDALEKMKMRMQYDLYYIEHWSLWFDLKIIFLTLFTGLVHPNAY